MIPEKIVNYIASIRCSSGDSACDECWITVNSVIKTIEAAGYTIQTAEEKEMETQTEEETQPVEEALAVEDTQNIAVPCRAPAPLVVNGSPYVGCQLLENHEGQHEVKVTWTSR